MGSTGDSTGQHLHFEIHLGEWKGNTVNAINPQTLIQF
jgi:murein DD-endopeptidase MepM/ murein hydrolase activator NlpD